MRKVVSVRLVATRTLEPTRVLGAAQADVDTAPFVMVKPLYDDVATEHPWCDTTRGHGQQWWWRRQRCVCAIGWEGEGAALRPRPPGLDGEGGGAHHHTQLQAPTA